MSSVTFLTNEDRSALEQKMQYVDNVMLSDGSKALTLTVGKDVEVGTTITFVVSAAGNSLDYMIVDPSTGNMEGNTVIYGQEDVGEKTIVAPANYIYTFSAGIKVYSNTYKDINDLKEELDGIKENGGSGGGVSSWNDLNDKPFGETYKEIVVFPEQDVTGEIDNIMSSIYWMNNITTIDYTQLSVGDIVIVTWDGDAYTCTVKTANAEAGIYIGNMDVFLDNVPNTGEPFVFMISNDGVLSAIGKNDGSTDTTKTFKCSITKVESVVEPLDVKFLPESHRFGEMNVEEIVYEKQIGTFADAGNGIYTWQMLSPGIALNDNTEYTVTWDETEHVLTSSVATFNGADGVALGNLAIAGVGEDTGETFLFGYFLDGSAVGCYTTETETEHVFSVTKAETVVKTIDPKYLPSTTSKTVLLGEHTFTPFAQDGDSPYTYFGEGDSSLSFITDGQTYTVIWDGVEYVVTAQIPDVATMAALGNLSITDANFENTGEPFLMLFTEGSSVIVTNETVESHVVEIYQETSTSALPEVTEADNGKILQVVDGAWTAVAITNGNEVAY